jgi:hypothetical protein
MQAINTMCAVDIDYDRDIDVCGPYNIDLTAANQVFTQ